MDKSNSSKSSSNPVTSDFDLFGEISLADDNEPDSSHFPISATQSKQEVSARSDFLGENAQNFQTSHSEIQDHLVHLEAKVVELESQNSKLAVQLSDCSTKETVSRSTETIDTRESGPHPGSIMSLSTGSEESAVDEERFVKVKPNCEIETSSSKASSQSGKENFELEEQIAGLAHEVDTLKGELKAKDEEYIRVKLELEAMLLEKNVETESISQASSQVLTLKDELSSKDSELDDIRLVLQEVIENCQEHLSGDSEPAMACSSSLEHMLFQISRISQLFKSTMESTKEREEELSNCITGYQAISADYEKLQGEFQSLKEQENTEAQEEVERFKQELLSKDEDLFEIQTGFDESQRALEARGLLVEELQAQLVSFKSQAEEQALTEKLYKEKLSQAQEKHTRTEEKLKEIELCLNQKSSLVTDLRKQLEATISKPVAPSLSPESTIKNLQQHCINKIQVTIQEFEANEKTLKHQVLNLHNDKSHLESLLSSKEEEIYKLNSEMERLMANIQVYQESIEQKTSELATCANSKVEEISLIKDGHIAHLAQTIESQRDEIFRLFQMQNEAAANIESMRNYVQQLETTLAELNATFGSYDKEREAYEAEIAYLQLEIKTKDEHLEVTNKALMEALENHRKMRELHAQSESDYSASIERLKVEIKAEFERKRQEEEVLRESEQLSDRKAIGELMAQLNQLSNELTVKGKEISGLTRDKWELEQGVQAKGDEIATLQERIAAVEQEIHSKNKLNEALTSELMEFRTALEGAKAMLNTEVQARSAAEATLFEYQQVQSKSLVVPEKAQQLEHALAQDKTLVTVRNVDQVQALQAQLQTEIDERKMSERKVELLQSKISEIENSEIKSFEESFMLKGWVRQLELENLKYQDQLNSLMANAPDAESNPKLKTLQDEVIRLINALEERDKRCEQLTLEITRLLEERDGLQLKLSNVLKHNVALTERINVGQETTSLNQAPTYDKEGLQTKLAQLEDSNYKMKIDLKREREARRLVQEQLLFSQTSRVYRDLNMRGRDQSGLSSVNSGNKSPSSLSQSPDNSSSDSGQMSLASLDSGDHLTIPPSSNIPRDPLLTSTSVVHI